MSTSNPTGVGKGGAQQISVQGDANAMQVFGCQACSEAALERVNTLLSRQLLPDGERYDPIQHRSFFCQLAQEWSASSAALGASYFQRLCRKREYLRMCVKRHGDVIEVPDMGKKYSPEERSERIEVVVTILVCVFLAAKMVDSVSLYPMWLKVYVRQVCPSLSDEQIAKLELDCLNDLDWRLGPFFNQNNIH